VKEGLSSEGEGGVMIPRERAETFLFNTKGVFIHNVHRYRE
jgi:hypothetical protein